MMFFKYVFVEELPKNPSNNIFYVMCGTEENPDGREHRFIEIWAWDSKNQSWCLCDKQYPEDEKGESNE